MQTTRAKLGSIESDLKAVLNIECANFTHPWTEDDFLAFLERGGIMHIAKTEKGVLGYICVAPQKHGWSIKSIAVRSDMQRKGIGSAMIQTIRNGCARKERLTCCVSERNTDAQLFLRAQGFKAVRVKRQYFSDGADGYVFRLEKRSDTKCSPCDTED